MDRKKAFKILEIDIKYNQLNNVLLKKYYKNACLKTHPDKKGSTDDFLKVKEAYDFLIKDLSYKYEDEDEFIHLYEKLIKYSEILKPFYHYFFMETIELNPSLYNLFKKDMYLFKEYNTYIPLWHKQIILFDKINILINPILPNNVIIDDENNIYIYIPKDQDSYQINSISFSIPININKIHFKGIPKINEKNIYDITSYSELIFIRS